METKNPSKILVVDDDPRLRDLLRRYLGEQGFNVYVAENAPSMNKLWVRERFDLLVLDLMLPGEDGLSICRRLRGSNDRTPIIMLTAKGEDVDRIVGLEMGADDYLPKPFHLRELLARVRSVLRRASARAAERPGQAQRTRVRFADWLFDLTSRALTAPDGNEVRLTSGEFELLAAFVTHSNEVLSRDQLLDLARGREAGPFDRTIDVQVGRLRRKIEEDPKNPTLIKTVRAGGYIFTPTIEPA